MHTRGTEGTEVEIQLPMKRFPDSTKTHSNFSWDKQMSYGD